MVIMTIVTVMTVNLALCSRVVIQTPMMTGFAHAGESGIGGRTNAIADKEYTGQRMAERAWIACVHAKAT